MIEFVAVDKNNLLILAATNQLYHKSQSLHSYISDAWFWQ